MPSTFAYLALFLWPLVVIALFRKRPLDEALAWSIIGGYMLLPQVSAFDLPMLPPWDKELVPSLAAAIMCYSVVKLQRSKSVRQATLRTGSSQDTPSSGSSADTFTIRRGKVLWWALIILLFGSPMITTLNNSEAIVQENRFVPGMRIYDGLSVNLALLVSITPFLLGRRFLASSESHAVLLKVFVVATLGYSLLVLWEVRFSPQLSREIYGFFPHRWGQHARSGGYRPIVFLNHGLWVAVLLAMSSIGAMALWRHKLRIPKQQATIWFLSSLYLFGVVVLCKSAGAILIAVLLLPVVFMFTARLQFLISAVIISIILIYPALRGADIIPVDTIYSSLAKINKERADSLQIRFDAEDKLLAHANEKPLTGWGSWGRNRVTNEKGADVAATDGYWAIVVGVSGWLGYVARFGLLGIASILLAFNKNRLNLTPATVGLVLILVVALIDLIPNATISPVVWLISGAIMGRYQTAQSVAFKQNISMERSPQIDQRPRPHLDNVLADRAHSPVASSPMHRRQPRKG